MTSRGHKGSKLPIFIHQMLANQSVFKILKTLKAVLKIIQVMIRAFYRTGSRSSKPEVSSAGSIRGCFSTVLD